MSSVRLEIFLNEVLIKSPPSGFISGHLTKFELNSNSHQEDNMNTAELIYEKAKQLPEPAANQVLDFISFIEQKEAKNKQVSAQNTDIMTHLQTSMKKNHRLGELLAK